MSTRRIRLPLLLPVAASLAVGTFAAPTIAAAQSCQGAPGASAIVQYCEAIPRGDGGQETSGGSGSSGGSGGSAGSGVSTGTSNALARAGADGAAIRRLAGDAGAGSGKGKSKSSKKNQQSGAGGGGATDGAGGSGTAGAGSGGAPSDPKDPSGSPLKAAQQAATSGPAAGQAVAWSIVGLSVFGALAAVGLRRQRGTLPPVGKDIDAQSQG